jgi:hypothetical protein
MIVIYYKYRISVRGGHCDHSPRVPKNLAAPLSGAIIKIIHLPVPTVCSGWNASLKACTSALLSSQERDYEYGDRVMTIQPFSVSEEILLQSIRLTSSTFGLCFYLFNMLTVLDKYCS